MQMYTTTMTAPDAERFMDQYKSRRGLAEGEQVAGPEHLPLRQRRVRQARPRPAESELDPVKRAALYIKMNDMVVNDFIVIPLISRPRVRGGNLKLVTTLSGWDLDFSALQNWYRECVAGLTVAR